MSMKMGGHGSNFKFLPVQRGSKKEHFPRILQIAGVYSELTAEQLYAPASTPAAPAGRWTYDFSDPEGPQLGTVAIPGSDVVAAAIDPVVMIATNTELGISVPEEVEVLVVVDRGDRDFNPENFYVFRTPENRLTVQWTDGAFEPGYDILGKVVVCVAPYVASMAAAATGFLEADEDDE
jgi:hypothetical protein